MSAGPTANPQIKQTTACLPCSGLSRRCVSAFLSAWLAACSFLHYLGLLFWMFVFVSHFRHFFPLGISSFFCFFSQSIASHAMNCAACCLSNQCLHCLPSSSTRTTAVRGQGDSDVPQESLRRPGGPFKLQGTGGGKRLGGSRLCLPLLDPPSQPAACCPCLLSRSPPRKPGCLTALGHARPMPCHANSRLDRTPVWSSSRAETRRVIAERFEGSSPLFLHCALCCDVCKQLARRSGASVRSGVRERRGVPRGK